MATLKEENSNKEKELGRRDKQIQKLMKKLELMFIENSEKEDKPLWEQVGDEDHNDISKDSIPDVNHFHAHSMMDGGGSGNMVGGLNNNFGSSGQQFPSPLDPLHHAKYKNYAIRIM